MQKKIIPANRLDFINEYFFSKKLKDIDKMNTNGADVINLGIGNPDLPPLKEAIDVLCDCSKQHNMHGYQPYNGIPELRHAFSNWYKYYYHVSLDPDTEIQPLIGSKEGILYVSLAFLNHGDAVLIPNPGYPAYCSVSNLVGASLILYDLKEDSNWQPDFKSLENLNLSKVKLMWINYPNMPTGALGSKLLFKKIVDFGKSHGIVICNDNPYSFILNNNPLSILKIEGSKDVCIELNSMSKSHNMPGWRMAMVASNPLFIQSILKVKSNVDSGQFKPMMLAAVKSLQAMEVWYTEMNKVYMTRRKIVEKIMKQLDCTFDSKQVGLFLWGKISNRYQSGVELSDKILKKARVFITPGSVFGNNGSQYIRISLCCEENRLIEALDRIKCKLL